MGMKWIKRFKKTKVCLILFRPYCVKDFSLGKPWKPWIQDRHVYIKVYIYIVVPRLLPQQFCTQWFKSYAEH